MTTAPYPYRHNFAAGYYDKGEARGNIDGVLKSIFAVLKARGLTLTDEERERIKSCTDVEQLDLWLNRSVSLSVGCDLFRPENLKPTKPYRYVSDFAHRHYDAGYTAGLIQSRAKSLVTILRTRSFRLTDDERERISSCGDADQLKIWIRRAVNVTTTDHLFS